MFEFIISISVVYFFSEVLVKLFSKFIEKLYFKLGYIHNYVITDSQGIVTQEEKIIKRIVFQKRLLKRANKEKFKTHEVIFEILFTICLMSGLFAFNSISLNIFFIFAFFIYFFYIVRSCTLIESCKNFKLKLNYDENGEHFLLQHKEKEYIIIDLDI